jgi:hypothetical protein
MTLSIWLLLVALVAVLMLVVEEVLEATAPR